MISCSTPILRIYSGMLLAKRNMSRKFSELLTTMIDGETVILNKSIVKIKLLPYMVNRFKK